MRIKAKLTDFCYLLMNEMVVLSERGDAPCMMTMQETLDRIANEGCSLTRFGDGELKWMLDIPQNSFQEQNAELKEKLREVMLKRNDRFIIALSPYFKSLLKYNAYARKYWAREMCLHRNEFLQLIDSSYKYGNLNVTRFYMDYRDRRHVADIIAGWHKIFTGRDLVIIEGEYSRLGLGNDLFQGADSVKRIICPVKNAFYYWRDILMEFLQREFSKDVLVLVALGPTATVLAWEIFAYGYQVLDIGHIDVEYMWYKQRAKTKIPIRGRYVNEAGGLLEELDNCLLEDYRKQIVARIGIL